MSPRMKKPGAVSRPGVMHRSSYILLDDGLLYEIRVTPVYENRQRTIIFAAAVLRPLRRAPPAMSTRAVDQRLLRFFAFVGVSLRRSATGLVF